MEGYSSFSLLPASVERPAPDTKSLIHQNNAAAILIRSGDRAQARRRQQEARESAPRLAGVSSVGLCVSPSLSLALNYTQNHHWGHRRLMTKTKTLVCGGENKFF